MNTWAADLKATTPEISPDAEPLPDAEAAARELAKLPEHVYEQRREEEAEHLGVRVFFLDKLVRGLRAEAAKAEAGSPEVVETLELWPSPVDGLALAEDVRHALLAHVVFPSEADADAATVWIIGTYLMDAWRLWPKLLIQSPEKRCGKTTFLEVVEAHVYRGLMTSSITGPALFRSIEKWSPTLLIDEADRFLRNNDELNGIINAGHTRRTARVIRTVEVNGEHDPRVFLTWAAQGIATIGSQPDTLEDRSIRIGLRRRLESEQVEEIPAEFFDKRQIVRRQLLRWVTGAFEQIKGSDIQPPPCGNDRARNNWAPLFRIAAALGGPWPKRVATAYALKEQVGAEAEESASVMVLRDVMELFAERRADRMQSSELVAALVEMEDRLWSEWKRGKPMTATSLARLLKPFGVKPGKIRFSSQTFNGYQRGEVEAAHIRYCPPLPSESGTPEQVQEINDLDENDSGTQSPDVPGWKSPNTLENNGCSGVPVREGGEL